VESGAIVETDGWRGYNPLEEMGFTRVILRAKDAPENPLPHEPLAKCPGIIRENR